MKKILCLLPLAALAGCDDVPGVTADVVKNYSNIVLASYEDSKTSAEALDASIATFVTTPSAANLTAAQNAWLASREPYLQTEVYRFYEGPIDNADTGPEGLMNAWPMDESFVDYVQGDATAGLINDATFDITLANLRDKNEDGGEENVTTGYHAIEFLLWGQDFNDDGPGDRAFTDYVAPFANADRRGLYLNTVSDALLEDLDSLIGEWSANGDYRTEFEAAAPKEGLRRILTGMIVLSGFETGGERLQAALTSGDQEDEHSCFSDNTHRDMIQDVVGIQNVWLGRYTRTDGGTVSGPGVKDVIEASDAALAASITTQIAESLTLANALQPPFDQEIKAGNTEGNARVQALVTSLLEQESLLEDAFRLYGLEIPVVE